MNGQCANCRRTNEENAQRVQKLERELATCQEYLRNYSERSEAQIKKSEAMIVGLRQQNKILTDENTKLNRSLQATLLEKPKKSAESNVNFERKEAIYIKMIKELEKKNQELLKESEKRTPREMDSDIVSILIERVQELEACTSPRTSTPSAPESSIPESTLEDYRFELAETKFAMEAYDPVGVATEVFNGVIEKTNDPLLIVEAQTKLEEFKKEFDEYMKKLDMAIAELSSTNPSTFHVNSMPIFPNPIDLDFFSKFETVLKTYRQPVSVSKCSICEQLLRGEGVPCVGCKTPYHPECGRIFAEQHLPCSTPNCSKSFTDTKWT